MTKPAATKLYTPNLLALATQLSDFPLDRQFEYGAEARSRTCGSAIELGVELDSNGKVSAIGLQVSACAIGQSSAAILASAAKGRSVDELFLAKGEIEAWLNAHKGANTPFPNWPGFEALAPAREHKGRHGALLLAWTAITQALSTRQGAR